MKYQINDFSKLFENLIYLNKLTKLDIDLKYILLNKK